MLRMITSKLKLILLIMHEDIGKGIKDEEDAVFMSPSLTQQGCRNYNVSVGIDLAKLKVSPTVIDIAVGDIVSFRNIARGSALSSIGVFLKIGKLLEPDNFDSERLLVWEVDFLPPGDALEWRATSIGEYHFESESYPFLRGFISVKEPKPLPFRQQLIADIATAQPKSQQGQPLLKPPCISAACYGSLKALEDACPSMEDEEHPEDDACIGQTDKETIEPTIDNVPYEPLKGGPDLAESTVRLLKEYEKISEENGEPSVDLRPSVKWSNQQARKLSNSLSFVEMDMDSYEPVGIQTFRPFDSLCLPPKKLNEAESQRYRDDLMRNFGGDDDPPTASVNASRVRLMPKVMCKCSKEFSSSLNARRCETLHLGLDQDGTGDRGGGRKGKAGSKKKDADQSSLISQRLLDLKDFWKQTLHIEQRAKILSLESTETHRKMSSSLLMVSLMTPGYLSHTHFDSDSLWY
jgi:hypothetical protein